MPSARTLFSLAAVAMAAACAAAGAAEWTVAVECQMAVVPQKLALSLVAELGDEFTAESGWQRLQELIAREEVTLAGNVRVRGNHNQRMISESLEEVKYATEFDPPQVPDRLPREKALEVLKTWPVVGVTPTAFETRGVGQSLELEAIVSADGKWIAMNVVAQHVRLLRWTKFDLGKLPAGDRLSIEQPIFHTMKDTVSVRLRNGQRVLLGVHKLPEPAKAFEFFLLHAEARPAGATR